MVKKLYLALVASPVPVGIMTHYMRPVNIAPRLVSEGNDSTRKSFGSLIWSSLKLMFSI